MNSALEQLSKQELIALLQEERAAVLAAEKAGKKQDERLQQQGKILQKKEQALEQKEDQVAYLKAQIDQLKRMLFGQKRERFEKDMAQLPLPFEADTQKEEKQQQVVEEKINYVRKKQKACGHTGRLALPNHLPVEEVEIYPKGDLSQMVCIGKEVTEELECVPARLFIRRYIRYKYAAKAKDAVVIGTLPERVIAKGIPGTGLLASILVDKYMDHLPLYRQRQRFLRDNINIASSTLEGWARQGLERLEILYECLREDTKSKGYLQADESPIKVLESGSPPGNKKGACHQGYYWVYHNPVDGTVLFDYQPTRGSKGPEGILLGFKGYLQSDGYKVYEALGKQQEVTHLACWAHARREFEKALDNDKPRAELALLYIQQLYAIEARARENELKPEARKELRLTQSLPILNAFSKWIAQQVKQVLPKSQMGKAMHYSIKRWDSLCAYLYDGVLEIDNNLVENAIRPLALGRKNYLFAGSHQAAQRAAMIYSFFAICKKHKVNPFQWLRYTLENILSTNHKNIRDLYPQNFHKMITVNC